MNAAAPRTRRSQHGIAIWLIVVIIVVVVVAVVGAIAVATSTPATSTTTGGPLGRLYPGRISMQVIHSE